MTDTTASVSAPPPGRFALYGRILAMISLLVSIVGGGILLYAVFGYHFGVAQLRQVLQGLLPLGARIAGVGAIACVIVTLGLLALRNKGARGARISAIGVIVGVVAFYIPYSVQQSAQGAPPIHDVTTDTDNPPEFVDALPLRKQTGARNPTEYLRESKLGGRAIDVPEAQHKAFPEIQPIMLPGVAPADAFKRALAAVDAMHWHLTAAKPEEGRIEAWDQTFWFRFIDDVVIRIAPTENGSRIDVRSLSRIGGGDAGTNARRIRNYLVAFAKT